MINRMGLVVHGGKAEARVAADRVQAWADVRGIPCTEIDVWDDGGRLSAHEEAEKAGHPDLIVTVGGDGTFLRGSRVAAPIGALVLGVNVGRVGFLTEVEVADLDAALEAVGNHQIQLDERMMLTMRASRPLEIPEGIDALLHFGRGPALPPPLPRSGVAAGGRLGRGAGRARPQRRRVREAGPGPAGEPRRLRQRPAVRVLLGRRRHRVQPDRLDRVQLRRRRADRHAAPRCPDLHAGRPAHGVQPQPGAVGARPDRHPGAARTPARWRSASTDSCAACSIRTTGSACTRDRAEPAWSGSPIRRSWIAYATGSVSPTPRPRSPTPTAVPHSCTTPERPCRPTWHTRARPITGSAHRGPVPASAAGTGPRSCRPTPVGPGPRPTSPGPARTAHRATPGSIRAAWRFRRSRASSRPGAGPGSAARPAG